MLDFDETYFFEEGRNKIESTLEISSDRWVTGDDERTIDIEGKTVITVGRDEYSINFAHSLTWEVDEDDIVMLTQSIAGSGKSGSRSRAKTFNAEVTGNFPGNWLSISSGRGVDAYTRLFSTFAMEDQNSFLEAAGDAEVPDIYLPSDGGYGLALQFWVTDEQILFNTFIDFMDTSLNALTPISSGEEDDCQEEGWIGVNVAVRNEFWVDYDASEKAVDTKDWSDLYGGQKWLEGNCTDVVDGGNSTDTNSTATNSSTPGKFTISKDDVLLLDLDRVDSKKS